MTVTFPEPTKGDEIRISASTYVMFQQCPDQANARLQGKYGPDSRPAFLGTLAHQMFSRHLNSGPIDRDEFSQACREEIGSSSLNHRMAGLEIKPSSLTAVIEEVRALYERFIRFPDDGFEGSEVWIENEPAEGVLLVGSIDAVFSEELEGHRLVDWKTGDLGSPEAQLLFYALLWALENEETPALVDAVSVRTGERFRTSPSESDLKAIADSVGRMISTMRSTWNEHGDFPRSAGPWCSYCPLLEECSEGQTAEALLN